MWGLKHHLKFIKKRHMLEDYYYYKGICEWYRYIKVNIPHNIAFIKSWKINIFMFVIVIQCIYFIFIIINQYLDSVSINIKFHNISRIRKQHFFSERWKEELVYQLSSENEINTNNSKRNMTFSLQITIIYDERRFILCFIVTCLTLSHYVVVCPKLGAWRLMLLPIIFVFLFKCFNMYM